VNTEESVPSKHTIKMRATTKHKHSNKTATSDPFQGRGIVLQGLVHKCRDKNKLKNSLLICWDQNHLAFMERMYTEHNNNKIIFSNTQLNI
jgi:hypothetical protein